MVLIVRKLGTLQNRTYRFRPLAGIMVLIKSGKLVMMACIQRFPSPCGDYGSYPFFVLQLHVLTPLCFRPLAGIMVLI